MLSNRTNAKRTTGLDKIYRSTAIFFSLLVGVLLLSSRALATPGVGLGKSEATGRPMRIRPEGFGVSSEVQGRIDFWKLVFTKYGENHLVFHHREHPEIIYSVLDLSDYKTKFGGKDLIRATNKAVDDEIARIQSALGRLADGNPPSGAAERRLVHLFSLLPGSDRGNYREAAQVEQIRYQKGVRELFREGLIRSGRYLHAMERVFVQEGLPIELTRLPLVESSFNYNAYSSVGAAGIWQFMRETGKKYMRIDASIDERKDPIMATRAAARYFIQSYNKLESWPLAVTSYNHGLTGVLRAVNSTGSKDLGTIIRNYDGESFGFASKNFYAEFMAAVEVEQRAQEFFPGLRREEPWHFDEVRLGRAISFSELVRYSGSNQEDVEKLNRALLAPVLKGRVKIPAGMIVRVPEGRGRVLLASCSGETIDTAAAAESVLARQSKRGSAPAASFSKNPTALGPSEKGGRRTEAKVPAKGSAPSVETQSDGRKYIVKKGDNPSRIAKKLGISIKRLKELNPGLGAKLKPGQVLTAGD